MERAWGASDTITRTCPKRTVSASIKTSNHKLLPEQAQILDLPRSRSKVFDDTQIQTPTCGDSISLDLTAQAKLVVHH